MQDKKQFVTEHLKPLIIALEIGVKDVEYTRKPHGKYLGDEYVIITFYNGYKVEKCVTGDSLPALCRDALKGL